MPTTRPRDESVTPNAVDELRSRQRRLWYGVGDQARFRVASLSSVGTSVVLRRSRSSSYFEQLGLPPRQQHHYRPRGLFL